MDYPLARTGFWAGVASLLAVLALTATACWWAWHGRVDSPTTEREWLALVGGALVAAIVLLAWFGWAQGRKSMGHLRWDGACWALHLVDGEPLRLHPPAVRVDLGAAVLLHASAQPGGGTRWLALERRDSPVAWHGLRVALLQRRPATVAVPGGAS